MTRPGRQTRGTRLAVTVDEVAYAIAGATVILFGAWLLYLSPRQRATRALAVVLASMGTVWLMDVVMELGPLAVDLAILRGLPVVFTVLGLSTIYFLCIYPRPRGWIGRAPAAPWALAGAGLALAAATLAFPDAWGRPIVEDGVLVGFVEGPFGLLSNAWSLTVVMLVLFLAIEHTRVPAGPVRRAITLVIAGFMASQIAWGSTLLFNDLGRRLSIEAVTPAIRRAEYLIEETLLVPVLAAPLVMLVAARRSGDAARRREAWGVALLAAFVLVVSALLAWRTSPLPAAEWAGPWQGVLDAAAGIGIAALCGYALLKHRLFDIDVKIRWTISRGTVAAIFVGIFFVASQVAQNFLEDSMGWAMGGIIAGVMLFAIAPIQRMADHVADVAFPARGGGAREKQLETYRLALAMALADRVITRDEERHLAQLAEHLGLGPSDAFTVREAVERELGVG